MNPSDLSDVMDERSKRIEQGLKLAFKYGELIPLKGIVFKVSQVECDAMILSPVSMTKKRAKEKSRG